MSMKIKTVKKLDVAKKIASFASSGVTCGVHKGAGKYKNGETVAYIASIQEYGTRDKKIPPRPFLFSTVEERKKAWIRILADGAKKALVGKKSVHNVLSEMGFNMANDVRNTIITKRSPKNAPSTIAKKGKDDPLVHSGKLADSIDYEVHK